MAEIRVATEDLNKQIVTETARQTRLHEAYLTTQAGIQADIKKATQEGSKASNTSSPQPGTPVGHVTGGVAIADREKSLIGSQN